MFTIAARIVEQAKLITKRQYDEISYVIGYLKYKKAWTTLAITMKKYAMMCHKINALSKSTSSLLIIFISLLNPHVSMKQEMTSEMFSANQTSEKALILRLLNRTQSIAGIPTVISVTIIYMILRLLL